MLMKVIKIRYILIFKLGITIAKMIILNKQSFKRVKMRKNRIQIVFRRIFTKSGRIQIDLYSLRMKKPLRDR